MHACAHTCMHIHTYTPNFYFKQYLCTSGYKSLAESSNNKATIIGYTHACTCTHMHTHARAHTHTHTHTICCQLSCSEKAAVILKLHLFHFPHYYMHWHHNSCKHASELCILCWNVWLFNSPSIVKSYCPNTLQNISWFKIIISSAKFYSWLNIYHNTVGNSTHFIF